jgi:uncharacterized protein YraI
VLSATPTASFTPPPAITPTRLLSPTITPSATPVMLPVTPVPTVVPPTPIPPTPAPPASNAQVCPSCGSLRLRASPGTAGEIVDHLAAETPLVIIGRTEDSAWVQVALADGRNGWVARQFLDITIDLNVVSVTGTAIDTAYPTAVAVVAPGNVAVVSGISSHARQIYQAGQARGNLPNVFSKVGDSITDMPFFFHQFVDTYSLGEYDYLAPALSFFSGPNGRGGNPFSTISLAARGGWNSDSVLATGGGDPSVCGASESPLQCEYRASRPAVALIMLGTNDTAVIPGDQFRANLERIVQISIDMGVIPVLSTIPPMQAEPSRSARVDELNQVIIATARAYDVPLWNYWQAMVNLPNQGLGPDGVHPSTPEDGLNAYLDAGHLQYGFPVRNLTGLQVLYELWRQVLYDADPSRASAPPPTVDPGPVVTTDPAAYQCPGAPPIRLRVGGQGRVTPGLPNRVRSAPSFAADQIGNIPGEAVFDVIGGPRCADAFTWWQVNYNGLVGWTASGNSQEYWVEPYP